MVKEFYLGLFAAIVCALAALTYAVPVTNISVSYYFNGSLVTEQPQEESLTDDGSIRSERSTNLSHITGSARKIRMYVKNRHLQVLPDGIVNGTSDDTSDFSKSNPLHFNQPYSLHTTFVTNNCDLGTPAFMNATILPQT